MAHHSNRGQAKPAFFSNNSTETRHAPRHSLTHSLVHTDAHRRSSLKNLLCTQSPPEHTTLLRRFFSKCLCHSFTFFATEEGCFKSSNSPVQPQLLQCTQLHFGCHLVCLCRLQVCCFFRSYYGTAFRVFPFVGESAGRPMFTPSLCCNSSAPSSWCLASFLCSLLLNLHSFRKLTHQAGSSSPWEMINMWTEKLK